MKIIHDDKSLFVNNLHGLVVTLLKASMNTPEYIVCDTERCDHISMFHVIQMSNDLKRCLEYYGCSIYTDVE